MKQERVLSVSAGYITTASGRKRAIGNRTFRAGDLVWTDGAVVFGNQRYSTPGIMLPPVEKVVEPLVVPIFVFCYETSTGDGRQPGYYELGSINTETMEYVVIDQINTPSYFNYGKHFICGQNSAYLVLDAYNGAGTARDLISGSMISLGQTLPDYYVWGINDDGSLSWRRVDSGDHRRRAGSGYWMVVPKNNTPPYSFIYNLYYDDGTFVVSFDDDDIVSSYYAFDYLTKIDDNNYIIMSFGDGCKIWHIQNGSKILIKQFDMLVDFDNVELTAPTTKTNIKKIEQSLRQILGG